MRRAGCREVALLVDEEEHHRDHRVVLASGLGAVLRRQEDRLGHQVEDLDRGGHRLGHLVVDQEDREDRAGRRPGRLAADLAVGAAGFLRRPGHRGAG